jgi:putative transposase
VLDLLMAPIGMLLMPVMGSISDYTASRWGRRRPFVLTGSIAAGAALLGLIEQALADAPRPGAPATFGPEQIVQVVAVACEPPDRSGRPIDHWTSRELADEVKKRRIVKDISPRTAGRFLKRGRPPAPQEPVLAER